MLGEASDRVVERGVPVVQASNLNIAILAALPTLADGCYRQQNRNDGRDQNDGLDKKDAYFLNKFHKPSLSLPRQNPGSMGRIKMINKLAGNRSRRRHPRLMPLPIPASPGNFRGLHGDLARHIVGEETQHQLTGKRPGLGLKVAHIGYRQPHFFPDFPDHRLLGGFAGLYEARQCRVKTGAATSGLCEQQFIPPTHGHNDTGTQPGIGRQAAGATGQGLARIGCFCGAAAAAAKLVIPTPGQHLQRAAVGGKCGV